VFNSCPKHHKEARAEIKAQDRYIDKTKPNPTKTEWGETHAEPCYLCRANSDIAFYTLTKKKVEFT